MIVFVLLLIFMGSVVVMGVIIGIVLVSINFSVVVIGIVLMYCYV